MVYLLVTDKHDLPIGSLAYDLDQSEVLKRHAVRRRGYLLWTFRHRKIPILACFENKLFPSEYICQF